MRISNLAFRSLWASVLLFACGLSSAASGQTVTTQPATPQRQQPAGPTVVLPQEQSPRPVAGERELYCGGFIQYEPVVVDLEIVGGEKEESQRVYTTGDYVFINSGAQAGMRVGQSFSVTPPRGPFDSNLRRRRAASASSQGVGQLRVTEVKDRVSVAQVTNACETILLGDLLRAVPQRNLHGANRGCA